MKRAVGEVSKAGGLRLREALEAIKAHENGRDGDTPREEVEHMQFLADELYGAVAEYRVMLAGELAPPVRRRSSPRETPVRGHHGKAQLGELLPGILLPQEIHALLGKRITEIDLCDTALNCLVAQARAESLVEALEVLKILPAEAIERLTLLIENTATAKLNELELQSLL